MGKVCWSLRFLLLDFIITERVSCKPAVVNGDRHHCPERAGINPYGVVAAVLVRAEEHVEVSDESGGKLFQCDVAHMVPLVEKLFQMLVNDLILVQAFGGFHSCLDKFLVVLVVLLKYFQQRVLTVFQTQEGVFDFLCRDIVVPVKYFLIVAVYLHTDFVQHAIGLQCCRTAACRPSCLRVPKFRVYGQLAAELALRAVNRDAAHYGDGAVFLDYLAFEVENA